MHTRRLYAQQQVAVIKKYIYLVQQKAAAIKVVTKNASSGEGMSANH